jgi:hypothetical protein
MAQADVLTPAGEVRTRQGHSRTLAHARALNAALAEGLLAQDLES